MKGEGPNGPSPFVSEQRLRFLVQTAEERVHRANLSLRRISSKASVDEALGGVEHVRHAATRGEADGRARKVSRQERAASLTSNGDVGVSAPFECSVVPQRQRLRGQRVQ